MPAQPATVPASRRRTPIMVLVGIVLATILAVGIYTLASRSDAVADTDPALFTDYVQALMGAQAAMPAAGYTDTDLAEVAASVGVSQAGQDAIESEAYEVAATQATEAAVNGGLTGTPAVAIDGDCLDYTATNDMQPGILADYIAALDSSARPAPVSVAGPNVST